MCTFQSSVLGAFFNTALGVTNETVKIINEKKNIEYRTRVALNNAKVAQNEALRQKQLGIDKSRMEKIAGIQEANKQKALSAASNLSLDSFTTKLNYEDNLDISELQADFIQNDYNAKAQGYFNQANNYIDQAKTYNRNYNTSLFRNALNALGKAAKVSNEWFENQRTNEDGLWRNFHG